MYTKLKFPLECIETWEISCCYGWLASTPHRLKKATIFRGHTELILRWVHDVQGKRSRVLYYFQRSRQSCSHVLGDREAERLNFMCALCMSFAGKLY